MSHTLRVASLEPLTTLSPWNKPRKSVSLDRYCMIKTILSQIHNYGVNLFYKNSSICRYYMRKHSEKYPAKCKSIKCTNLLPHSDMHRTVEVWPYRVCLHAPVSAFHTFKVRSVEPLMMMLPDICDDHTPPVCPTNVRKHWEENKRDHWSSSNIERQKQGPPKF